MPTLSKAEIFRPQGSFRYCVLKQVSPESTLFPAVVLLGDRDGLPTAYPSPTVDDPRYLCILDLGHEAPPLPRRGRRAFLSIPRRVPFRVSSELHFQYRCRSVNLRSVAFTQERSRPFDGNNEEDILCLLRET